MKNCFAYKSNRCTALKVRNCEGCNFYKTKDQQVKDKGKAKERILSLDEEKSNHINQTYYKGKLEVD